MALIIDFDIAVCWLTHLQTHTDSCSTHYIVQHRKVTVDDEMAHLLIYLIIWFKLKWLDERRNKKSFEICKEYFEGVKSKFCFMKM